MEAYVCLACGVQRAPSPTPPAACPICQDERQYVPPEGQRWATLGQLRREGRRIVLRALEEGLWGVGVEPSLGIGQRALLVQTAAGNVLWDCVGYIDEDAVAAIASLGGIRYICPSYPHFYGAMVEWARAFGATVLVTAADRQWVPWPAPEVAFWQGEREVLPGLTLVQCGGHFPGSAVLHWAQGAGGKGALLTGDTVMVTRDRRHLSFMWSYPNLVPLPLREVVAIVRRLRPLPFDRIYGGWWESVIPQGAKEALERSLARYLAKALG